MLASTFHDSDSVSRMKTRISHPLVFPSNSLYTRPVILSDLLMGSNSDSSRACRPAGSTRRYFDGSAMTVEGERRRKENEFEGSVGKRNKV